MLYLTVLVVLVTMMTVLMMPALMLVASLRHSHISAHFAQIEFCPRHYPLKIAAQLCRGFKLCFYEIAPNCHRNCWIQYL